MCGCNKNLSVEQMESMSLDQVIELKRQGYSIKEYQPANVNSLVSADAMVNTAGGVLLAVGSLALLGMFVKRKR